jgi:XTP/dITP diphosphohydrolase
MTETLVLASTNRGKLEEFRVLLSGVNVVLVPFAEVARRPLQIVEDGRTFAENALKKARVVAEATMMLTLADDSGLEVDALDGRPGVRSARFAHERATDAENNAALLEAIDGLGDPTVSASADSYPARFRCALALVDPYGSAGEPTLVEGRCEGAIIRSGRGAGGFGYDPLFVVAGMDKTMAELTEAEKNAVSHRAQACLELRAVLEGLLLAREEQTVRISGSRGPSGPHGHT